MALFSVLSILRMVANTMSPTEASDFHQFWYAGHFIRQGSDPYQAYFSGEQPSVPVAYVDGVVTSSRPVAQPGLATAPANTAPIVLLLSPFAFFSWPLAKVLWMVCNLVLALLCPWLLLRLAPPDLQISGTSRLLLFFVFFSFLGTRNAIGNGQTTLLVFAMMIGALLTMDGNCLLPGVLLGIALSKYSVAVPVLFLALYRRKYWVVIVSLAVQVIAVLAIAMIAGSSPLSILADYVRFMLMQVDSDGIHLAPLLQPIGVPAPITGAILTLGVGAALARWAVLPRAHETARSKASEDLHLMAIFCLWSLLAGYHRPYDSLVALLPVALLTLGLEHQALWKLYSRQRLVLAAALGIFLLVLMSPGAVMSSIASDWTLVLSRAITVVLFAMLVIFIWLLFRLKMPTRRSTASVAVEPSP